MNDVDPLHGPRHAFRVADIAGYVLDFPGTRAVLPDIQDANLLAALEQAPRDEIPQKTRTTRYQMSHSVLPQD